MITRRERSSKGTEKFVGTTVADDLTLYPLTENGGETSKRWWGRFLLVKRLSGKGVEVFPSDLSTSGNCNLWRKCGEKNERMIVEIDTKLDFRLRLKKYVDTPEYRIVSHRSVFTVKVDKSVEPSTHPLVSPIKIKGEVQRFGLVTFVCLFFSSV